MESLFKLFFWDTVLVPRCIFFDFLDVLKSRSFEWDFNIILTHILKNVVIFLPNYITFSNRHARVHTPIHARARVHRHQEST